MMTLKDFFKKLGFEVLENDDTSHHIPDSFTANLKGEVGICANVHLKNVVHMVAYSDNGMSRDVIDHFKINNAEELAFFIKRSTYIKRHQKDLYSDVLKLFPDPELS